jgi:hypothetical protein
MEPAVVIVVFSFAASDADAKSRQTVPGPELASHIGWRRCLVASGVGREGSRNWFCRIMGPALAPRHFEADVAS